MNKQNIINILKRLPYNEYLWLNQFTKEEKDFIIHLCETQKRGELETNGTASDINTQTKLRKLKNYWNV